MSPSKHAIRQSIRTIRRRLSPRLRRCMSEDICRLLGRFGPLHRAGVIQGYYPVENEADIRPLFGELRRAGRTLVLPRVAPDTPRLELYRTRGGEGELIEGMHGIPEPDPDRHREIERTELDLVLIPGLVFDTDGNRIGFGGGYFDRFLSSLPGSVVTVGVGYQFQVRSGFPMEEHDRPVDVVVTEHGYYP